VTRDLGALFDPRSVAIVGASNDPGKWGHWLARGALKGEERRPVFLVNRNGGEILERPAYQSLADLPEAPELVVLSVPAAGFEEAVEASLAAGARALVGISAGLGESGPQGRARERAVVERVRESGAVLLGPNCLGVFDAFTGLDLSSNEVPAGPLGFISQSGNLALEIGLLARDVGLGFSRFVSLGNQADLEARELVEALAAHEPTRVITVYLEDFRDGRAFARAAHAAVSSGKPVVLLPGGTTEASAGAARSHTGALVSELAAVEAACRAAGIELVATPRELVDVAQALRAAPAAAGRRLAIVADGGGHGVIAADLVARYGLELPTLASATAAALADTLPPTASTANPVDLAGGGEQDVASFARTVEVLLGSGEVDAVLLTGYFGGYAQYSDDLRRREIAVADALADAVTRTGRTLLVQTMHWRSSAATELRSRGVPVYREVEGAVRGLLALVHAGAGPAPGVPALPEPAELPLEAAGYWEARNLLQAAGVRFVDARRAEDLEQALTAARELGYPVVLKALGRLHKSDGGGVAVGLADEEALVGELSRMATALTPSEYSVERTAPTGDGVELIVGARRDSSFGPIALVGLGGLFAEAFGDVAVALAPVRADEAEALIRSLAAAPVLAGARGRPPVDVAAAARVAAALSRVAAERPEIAEIEINPLLVLADGALALDARIVLGKKGGSDAS
jgi:acetate---CoA ligase (ADP-forming)